MTYVSLKDQARTHRRRKNTMGHNHKFLLALACFALATPIFAAESPDWFQIELLVFAHTDEATAGQERWPLDPGTPGWANAGELIAPEDAEATGLNSEGVQIVRLPATAFAMSDANARLRHSRDYRVIAHTAWRQAIPSQGSGTPIFIDDSASPQAFQRITKEIQITGAPPVVVVKPDSAPKSESAPGGALGLDTPPPAPPRPRVLGEGPPNLTVYGTLAIRQTRFLHAVLDLLYRTPQTSPASTKTTPSESQLKSATLTEARATGTSPIHAFRLTETRRLRTGEIHYFDHPLFGALLRVVPVSSAAPVENETPAAKPAPAKKVPAPAAKPNKR